MVGIPPPLPPSIKKGSPVFLLVESGAKLGNKGREFELIYVSDCKLTSILSSHFVKGDNVII